MSRRRSSIIREDASRYQKTPLGLMIKTIDFRTERTCEHDHDQMMRRPVVEPGTLYVDHEFPMHVACPNEQGIEWKRPGEIVASPALFTDGTTRFDVGQGAVGSCWFLSVVADVAANDAMIKQLFPPGAYLVEDPSLYDGVFHAKFFQFGQWRSVYIDDYLPVWPNGRPWGAHSASDPREMWVALLEKAFARLHGSYDAICGGQACDSYQQLTGGCAESIDHKNYRGKPGALHTRISNALRCDSQVTSSVLNAAQGSGLVGGHTYSLTGTTKVGNTKLVRIRNPWGNTEWKGPWSDGSPEWQTIPDKVDADDGEFYMSIDDFIQYFDRTTICSITPDVDCDGKSDNLNFNINGYGNWREGCAGGFDNCLVNPRYCFTVLSAGTTEDGKVPCVIEIIQHVQERKTDVIDIRLDTYRILSNREGQDGRPTIVMEKRGPKEQTVTYVLGRTAFYRHMLQPGDYMVIPSTLQADNYKEFLIRCFSPAPVKQLTELSQDVTLLTCDHDEDLQMDGEPVKMHFEKTVFGDFVAGKNAGGQASFQNTFHTNPQYVICIPGKKGGKELLSLHVMQARIGNQYPMGVRLFRLDDGVTPPVDYNYLARHYGTCPRTTDGQQHKFIASWNVDASWELPPGKYLALLFFDAPNAEKEFSVVFRCTTGIQIEAYQTEGPDV